MPSKNLSLTFKTATDIFSLSDPACKIESLLERLPSLNCLRELWFFGIQYDDGGTPAFARLDKKVSKYKTPGSNTINLRLKVRYYPTDIVDVIEEITLKQFYHEARQAIIDGEIYCPNETAVILASYQACIRFGAYNPEIYSSDNFRLSDFLPEHVRELHHRTDEQWIDQLAKLHQGLEDIAKEDAILEYLKIAQELDMYGVAYYPVKNKRGTSLYLGICPFGLNIYSEDNKLIPQLGFAWSEIKTLSYNGAKLVIKPVDESAARLTCYCASSAARKEITDTCIGYHSLREKLTQLHKTIEIQQMKSLAKQKKEARQAERVRLAAERSAREAAEKRVSAMEQALQKKQLAFERSQAALTDHQRRVEELEEQLEVEHRARLELEAMQRRLEEVNQSLERENLASVEERTQLLQKKEAVELEIARQREVLEQQEAEKRRLEELVQKGKSGDANGNGLSEDRDIDFSEDKLNEVAIPDTALTDDVDYAKQLSKVKSELDSVRDTSKLNAVDVIYEENAKKGMDKYRTLHQIRQGNTKKRVEQFECL